MLVCQCVQRENAARKMCNDVQDIDPECKVYMKEKIVQFDFAPINHPVEDRLISAIGERQVL